MNTYYSPTGDLPSQADLMTGRAVFTEAYAVIPKKVITHAVSSHLPNWEKTRVWILARPLSGFAETFSQYIMEVGPGGGSDRPEPEKRGEGVIFVTKGKLTLHLKNEIHEMEVGGYAYIPANTEWRLWNTGSESVCFHWVRKLYEEVEGINLPDPFVTNEKNVDPRVVPDTEGRWAATLFVDPDDLRHDMHVNIVTFKPGGIIPYEETHVMEHGLYVLSGKAVYKLNRDWVEVEAGDFMWLRAFCPQACYAGGPELFRYLLYKDVNRHAKLRGVLGGAGL